MAYTKLPEFEQMTQTIQEKARPILEETGTLEEKFRLLALNENIYNVIDEMVQNYLLKETHLPYFIKEVIALLISKENSYTMCVDVHRNIAKILGLDQEQIETILQGVDAIQIDEETKALLYFCIQASKKDIEAIKTYSWSNNEILEAVAITGFFNYINTLSNVFGLGK